MQWYDLSPICYCTVQHVGEKYRYAEDYLARVTCRDISQHSKIVKPIPIARIQCVVEGVQQFSSGNPTFYRYTFFAHTLTGVRPSDGPPRERDDPHGDPQGAGQGVREPPES